MDKDIHSYHNYKKRAIIALSIYIGVIVFFSIIYRITWKLNSDSFLINNEINESPIEKGRDYLKDNNKSKIINNTVVTNLNKIQQYLDNEISTLELQKKTERNLLEKVAKYEKIIRDLRERNLKIASWKKANKIRGEVESLKKDKKLLENFKNEYIETRGNIDIHIAPEILEQINLSIIAINQKILEKELWVFDESEIRQVLALFDQGTIDELKKTIKNKSENIDRLNEIKEQIAQLKTDLKKKIDQIHKNRAGKLGYIDFLYFSIITSTTTGYGDIVPNQTLVRVFVIIQLASSLTAFGLFLAWFVEFLKNKSNRI